MGESVARAKPERIVDMDFRLFSAPEEALGNTDVPVSVSEIAVDRKRPLELGNSLRDPIGVNTDDPQTHVSRCLFGRDRQRLDGERLGRRQMSGPVIAHVRPSERAFRASGPDNSVDIVGVERKGALEQPARLREAIRSEPPVVRAHSLKIEVHRVWARRTLGAPGLRDDELRVESICEAGDDLVLHIE